MVIPTTQEILLFKLMLWAIVFFLAQRMLSHFSLICPFVCQKYAVILLELSMFETVKEYFSGNCTADCCFVCSIICRLFHWIYFFILVILSWSTTLHYKFHYCLTCVQEYPYLPQWSLQLFSPIIFYHVPPIFIESESIWYGASTSLSPNFYDNGKDVLSNNLHLMEGIYKEGWLWNFLIKFSFGWLQNLTPGTFGWMLEHSLHCAAIVTDDDINDKEAII